MHLQPPNLNAQTAIDMDEARCMSTVDIYSIRDIIYGGREVWQKRENIVKILSEDPIFDRSRRHYWTRTELYMKTLAMMNRVEELKIVHGWSEADMPIVRGSLGPMPTLLHGSAFEPVIRTQGSSQLVSKYAEVTRYNGIFGCYLQTELGHGSNIAELETTSTYHPETEEFEIHSPTLTSTKWWVGALGKTATHGVVQAQLILPGPKKMGPHLFLVQLRSLHDHKPLPGIKIGDIGPKAMAGYAAVDNGYARFDHVRISRHQMLSKFASVTEDGKYTQPPHNKIGYIGMLYIRSIIVTLNGFVTAKAATISIRYATVRRQGNKDINGLERQVITYSSTYYRLLPILSRAYVYIFLGRNLAKLFDETSSRLQSGDTSLLANLHAISSSLKVLVTTSSIADIEVARRSMGGHGFSAFAGLGLLYADNLPTATFEGDNFVLDQQVARAAMKDFQRFRDVDSTATPKVTPFSAYLQFMRDNSPPSLLTADSSTWDDPQSCVKLLQWRAARIVSVSFQHMNNPDPTVNQRVSRAVSEAFSALQVGDIIANLPVIGKEKCVLSSLLRLYLLTTVESALVDIFSFDSTSATFTTDDRSRNLRMAIDHACQELLPEAIALTDAFGWSDWELDSALGVYDGRVYETLWNKVQSEPLNETEVTDGYKDHLKPMLERGQNRSGFTIHPKL